MKEKNRENEASFPKTEKSQEISERFANYVIGGVIIGIFFQN